MIKSEILKTLINSYCDGNKAQFALMIGVTPQLLSNWIKRDTFDYERVYFGCKNLSGDWLITGEGEMYRQDKQNDYSHIDNKKLIFLCKALVENYQQRDKIFSQLDSMVKKME